MHPDRKYELLDLWEQATEITTDPTARAAIIVAGGLFRVADALHRLGTADAATPMGALEAHGALLKEIVDDLCLAVQSISTAIDEVAAKMPAKP